MIIKKFVSDLVFFRPLSILYPQVVTPSEDPYLHTPALTKQFLISPPTSPPVGWQQPKEDRPVVDYDLLQAMAQLAPGQYLL